MKLQITDELRAKIEKNFKNDPEFKEKLYNGDEDSIGQVCLLSQDGIKAEDVVEAYENNLMDYLYQKAKKRLELRSIYEELFYAYYAQTEDTIENNKQTKGK